MIELSSTEDSSPPEPTLHSLGLPQPDFHAVILDFSPVSFVDTVSIKILKNVRGWRSRQPPRVHPSPGPSSGCPNGCCLLLFLGKAVCVIYRSSGISVT